MGRVFVEAFAAGLDFAADLAGDLAVFIGGRDDATVNDGAPETFRDFTGG
jgi:hypothetical protein